MTSRPAFTRAFKVIRSQYHRNRCSTRLTGYDERMRSRADEQAACGQTGVNVVTCQDVLPDGIVPHQREWSFTRRPAGKLRHQRGVAWGVKWLNAYRHFNGTAMELIAWRG